jgi:hypothetical protein
MYVIQDDGRLIEMNERAYDSEDLLQSLLASYPNLLAGDQIDRAAPRRWLLITREMAVPSEEAGAGRWSVDHLFLDQDAIPTLVEVKRSSDTRIRREVVGQLLDYAANAVVYWPIETIRARFETYCQLHQRDPEQVVATFLGPEGDGEAFWQQVKTNLLARRIRLVFVADVIPPELQRIVEFLNEQMRTAEVLAVEIRQYVGQGVKTLVPRVLGQTAEAQQQKTGAPRPARQWDEASFFQDVETRRSADEARIARAILAWANARALRIWWGKGSKDGSFFPVLDIAERSYSLFTVWTYGRVEVLFQWLKEQPPFADEAQRLELLRRLNQLPGVTLPADAITRRPSVLLAVFQNDDVLQQFLATIDWVIQEIRAA